ncbi:MAG: DNA-3-methyladenine glycosylase family protein [Vicinamibacterales bacterium]
MRLDGVGLERARRHLAAADPVMARLLSEAGAMPLPLHRGGSGFAYLSRAILAQQISGAAARSIAARVTERFGWPWRPEQLLGASDAELRGFGLSRQKVAYLRDLAAHARDGLPFQRLGRMDDERVIETLTVVKGIGRWTAEMYLMFRLGRHDVLPVDDLGIRSAMRRAYAMRALPDKRRMLRIAEAWRPYRSLACFHLWHSLDAARQAAPRPRPAPRKTR